jgi:hypothetical protein
MLPCFAEVWMDPASMLSITRASLAVRRDPQEITLSEFHRWGEPLPGGISRAVVAYLTAGAPFRAVDVAPWPLREKYDYLIQLHVLHFEGVAPASTVRPDDRARRTALSSGEGDRIDCRRGLCVVGCRKYACWLK